MARPSCWRRFAGPDPPVQPGADLVTSLASSVFALPDHLAPKADPVLIGRDEQHFAAVAATLEETIADLAARLEQERRAPAGSGQEAMDRDLEVHRLSTRLRTLRRFGVDLSPELCKGLEFDLVVLVDPESWGEGIEGAVDRYVAMTRATQQLVVLASS